MHELNLLPPIRRRLLRQQSLLVSLGHLFHQLIIAGLVIALVGLACIGFLWFNLQRTPQTAALIAAIARYQEFRAQISQYNNRLQTIDTSIKEHYVWSKLLPEFFAGLPVGVTIQAVTVTTTNEERKMTISGQANSRAAIVLMQERFKNIKWVATVDSPPANLLERTNPTYTFTVTLKPAGELL